MADRTIAEKLKFKPGMKVYVAHVPTGIDLGVPDDALADRAADADFILVFAETQAEAEDRMRAFAPSVGEKTVAWVSYPKGSKAAGRDINRDTIWRFAEQVGLIVNANYSIDDVWSAVRMRQRRQGE